MKMYLFYIVHQGFCIIFFLLHTGSNGRVGPTLLFCYCLMDEFFGLDSANVLSVDQVLVNKLNLIPGSGIR